MVNANMITAAMIFILGLMIGSFLNVCIYRIPRKESIVFPASHCPSCGGTIKFRDNVPVLSYLLLRGRCRFCRARIPFRYPLVELCTAVLLLVLFKNYGLTVDFFVFGFFTCVLILISAIDFEHLLIPNVIIIPSIGIGFVLAFARGYDDLLKSMAGFAAGGGIILLIAVISPFLLRQEGIGGGDIKLAGFIGIFLGGFVLMALFLGFLFGGLVGIALIVGKNKKWKDAVTFGPFLSLGSLVTLFFGANIWTFYLNLVAMK